MKNFVSVRPRNMLWTLAVSLIGAAFFFWIGFSTPPQVRSVKIIMPLMGLLLVAGFGLMTYIAWKLKYTWSASGLDIHWGVAKTRIRREDIVGLTPVESIWAIKTAGGAMPGFYFGGFTTLKSDRFPRLNFTAWSTKMDKGLYVSTRERIYFITPADRDGFIAASGVPLLAEPAVPPLIPAGELKLKGAWLFWAAVAVILIAAVIIAIQPNTTIPMHYNIHGEIDRYGSPREFLIFVPGVAGAVWVLLYWIAVVQARHGNRLSVALGAMSLFIALLFSTMALTQIFFH